MQSITPHIRFIGAEDDNLDLFEGQYPIPNGVSYNSYLIADEHITIVDAVDIRRYSDWLAAIADTLDELGATAPEYMIVQHVEPDHTGSISTLISRYPDIKIVCTAKAASMLGQFFDDIDFTSRCIKVADGDTFSLGRTQLRFITAPMVHWPEVMITLDETDGVLFSADAFGTFAMSTSTEAWDAEARRYYTNIVGRFGASVQALLKKVAGADVKVIAPLHGPVLKENLDHYIGLYDKWSRWEPESNGVLVAYASIYGGTAEAARRMASKLEAEGAEEVVLLDLCRHHVSYAVAEAFRLSRIVLCSVTYDGDLMPAMHEFLHHLDCKKLCNRRVGIIENGTWAPVAGRLMTAAIEKMKGMEIVAPMVTLRSRLHNDNLPAMRELAKNITSKN